MIIQCDSGHLNSDLIACARYRVCDEAIQAKSKNRIRSRDDTTHVLFVIRLPQQEIKSQFVGFQGDPWISVHIDDLRPTSEATVIPEQALSASISEIFIGQLNDRKQLSPDNNEIEEQGQHYKVDFQYENDLEEARSSSSSASYDQYEHDSDSDFGDETMMMGVENTHLSDPSLNSVSLSPSENMEPEELPADILPENIEPLNVLKTTPFSQDEVQAVGPQLVVEKPTSEQTQEHELPTDQVEHTTIISFHPQHNRLLGCVQAAVSMLKDSQKDRAMDRIQILMALIPKAPSRLLGDYYFTIKFTYLCMCFLLFQVKFLSTISLSSLFTRLYSREKETE